MIHVSRSAFTLHTTRTLLLVSSFENDFASPSSTGWAASQENIRKHAIEADSGDRNDWYMNYFSPIFEPNLLLEYDFDVSPWYSSAGSTAGTLLTRKMSLGCLIAIT